MNPPCRTSRVQRPLCGAHASAQKAVNKDTVIAPDGTYLGSDPDANVRLELRRDECTWGC